MAVSLQKVKTQYGIVGECEALNRALDSAIKVAPTDMSVLIIGESGVGKEVIPRIIHDLSGRKSKKYIAVNCGSIPEGTIDSELFGHEKGSFTGAIGEHNGYFGAADGGTLFLDEVGELPMSTQARLLRVLETGEYMRVGSSEARKTNVRIVAATNVNMPKAIATNHFRRDLYYRLNVMPISMPPLRERGEDILLLFKKFALETAEKYERYKMGDPVRLDKEAGQVFLDYSWPGNIRQLRNIVENLSVRMTGDRTVTPSVIEALLPELLHEEGSHSLMAADDGREKHNYDVEREVIFKMLLELHADVETLKRIVGGKKTDGKKALPLDVLKGDARQLRLTSGDKTDEFDEYEEQ